MTLVSLSRHSSLAPRGCRGRREPCGAPLTFFCTAPNPYRETLAELLDPGPRHASVRRTFRPAPALLQLRLRASRPCRRRRRRPELPRPAPERLVRSAWSRLDVRAGRRRRIGSEGGQRAELSGQGHGAVDRGVLAPAGGIRASITDMARLAQALLDGSAPGLAALDPVATSPDRPPASAPAG